MATLEHSIILEAIYAFGFALIGLIINRIGKFFILCKNQIMGYISFEYLFKCPTGVSVVVLVGCGVAGILTVYIENPTIAIYMYVILLCCGLSVPVVNAATIDLYPTHSR